MNNNQTVLDLLESKIYQYKPVFILNQARNSIEFYVTIENLEINLSDSNNYRTFIKKLCSDLEMNVIDSKLVMFTLSRYSEEQQ